MASDQLLTKRIGDDFSCVGQWWIPNTSSSGKPSTKRCGTLTFSHGEAIKLEIIGWFGENALPEDFSSDRTIEMIHGISTEGEVITLIGCQRVGITVGQASAESYLINAVFSSKDAWFAPNEPISFKSLILQFTHLHEWVGISGFEVPTQEQFGEMMKGKKAEIVYKRPERPEPIKIKDYMLSINFGHTLPGIGPATQKAVIEQTTSLIIRREDSAEIVLDELRTLTAGIQNFLSLVTFVPIYPTVIEGTAEVDQKKSKAVLRLLYEPIGTRKASKELSQRDMLFTYKDVAHVLENALNKMLVTERDRLEPVLNQFFAEYFSPSEYVEDRFMAAMRAIEAFHRRTCEKDYYVDRQVYLSTYFKRLCEPIKDVVKDSSLPRNLRQSFEDTLKNKMSYGYQYSLKRRLDELFETSYGEEFLALFAIRTQEKEELERRLEHVKTESEKEQKRKKWFQEQKDSFIRKIVVTRNWFTHFDEEDGHRAIKSGQELAYLNLRLELFIITLLLGYVGIPLETVETKLKHHKFDYLRLG